MFTMSVAGIMAILALSSMYRVSRVTVSLLMAA